MFARMRIILSVFGLLSCLAACSAASTVDVVTPLPPTTAADISSTPQATAGAPGSLRFDCQKSREIPVEECQALVALYKSTDGDHWLDNSGWLVDEMPCTWYGVKCQVGHIVELELYYNELSGSLPPEIGNLTYLQNLYLDNNQLSGLLPKEIGNLAKLQVGRLGGNQFTGSIPAEIANLKDLVYLALGGNQLSGEVPGELGNFSNLQELYLGSNQFTGSIPPELGNLVSLTQLHLSHNQLTGSIPATLGNLSSLNELDLSFNQLTGSIPTDLAHLSRLYRLYLSYNRLTGTVPPTLAKAPISDLRLWGNLLDGTVPASQGTITAVEYHGVKFELDSALAKSIWPETVAALPPVNGEFSWATRPEHIRFTFASHNEPDPFQGGGMSISGEPQIFIYPTEAFSAMDDIVKGEIEGLQTLLDARPASPENEIPVLPLINAAQVFHVQLEYLDFQNGSGVRFITHYSQENVSQLTNKNIFYTFQGLTQDGDYYVAAYFPISVAGLRDKPVDEVGEAALARLAEDVKHLDSLSSHEFEPDLDILDRVIQSLIVNPP